MQHVKTERKNKTYLITDSTDISKLSINKLLANSEIKRYLGTYLAEKAIIHYAKTRDQYLVSADNQTKVI